VDLSGIVTNDLLHAGLVNADLGTSERGNTSSDPGDQDELGSLAFAVTSGNTDETVLGLGVIEVRGELSEVTSSGGLNDDLVVSLVSEDDPAGGVGVVSHVLVSLSQSGITNIDHCEVCFGKKEKKYKVKARRCGVLKKKKRKKEKKKEREKEKR